MRTWSHGPVFSSMALAGLLFSTCSVAGHASWFSKGQPIPQWGLDAAKTRTPEYAKDAAAVILFDEYLETIDGQGRAVEREREAIRILKPQGRGNTCEVSYDETQKVNYFRVWTIAADEKQYQAQDTDFIERGDTDVPIMLSTRKRRMAHPPAADVGATIICESEELMEPYMHEKLWEIQNGIPVVFEALELNLTTNRPPASSWHQHDAVKPVISEANRWRWELHDVQALTLRDIPSTPDWTALAGRMSVQWGEAAVDGRDNQWRAIGEWVTSLEQDRTAPSPEITAKVNELISGAPDFYTKLSRITTSIQKDIRYFIVMRGIGALQANHAADIYRNRYGDCKDKTTLLISMLQVAGIHAYYVPVDDRRGVVDPDNPSLMGDHMITAIEIPDDVHDPRLMAVVTAKNGKRYLIFDPTDERTAVGNLRCELQGSYGTLAAGSDSQVIQIPVLPPDSNGTERKGSFTLAVDGTLTGSVDSFHSGPEGGDLRLALKYSSEKDRREAMEGIILSDLPGSTVNALEFVQPPSFDKPAEIHFKVITPEYARTAGPLLMVRPRVLGSDAQSFDAKPRSVPISLSGAGRWHDTFDITLPPGFVVDELPDPVKVDVDFASYQSTITAKGNQLHYEREFIVRQVELPADKAASFRKLEGAILMDEKNNAVLRKQ